MFTLEQIQVLTSIVETGSLSKAAKKLNKTKGTISVTLANLEDELNIQLFDRSGWQLALTEVGEKIYPELLLLQRQAIKILNHTQSFANDIEPILRLGIQKIIPPIELYKGLNKFHQAFPNTELQLIRGSDRQLEQQLRNGEIDLLIRVQAEASAPIDLEFCNAGILEFAFVCAPDHALADVNNIDNEQLLKHKQIILDLGTEDSNNRQKVAVDATISATLEDLLYQVEMGYGWCFLPAGIFEERRSLGGLIKLKPSFEGEHSAVIMLEVLNLLAKPQGPALKALKAALQQIDSAKLSL